MIGGRKVREMRDGYRRSVRNAGSLSATAGAASERSRKQADRAASPAGQE
jgi:hypothetical protein